jgi:hypothetical protein
MRIHAKGDMEDARESERKADRWPNWCAGTVTPESDDSRTARYTIALDDLYAAFCAARAAICAQSR